MSRILVLLVMFLGLTGCGLGKRVVTTPMNHPVDKPTVPVMVDQVASKAATVHELLVGKSGAKVVIEGMSADNLPESKAKAIVLIEQADSSIQEVIQQAPEIKKSAIADAAQIDKVIKENVKLKEADPVRQHIEFSSYWLIGLGILLIAASFLLTTYLPLWVGQMRTAGIFCLVVGLVAATVAYYLTEIRVIIACILGAGLLGGLIWAVIYAIQHRNNLIQLIKSIETGKAAGVVTFSDKAAAVLNPITSPQLKATVDKVQESIDGTKKSP